jgi:predicted acylesterase/phospholipase RssA
MLKALLLLLLFISSEVSLSSGLSTQVKSPIQNANSLHTSVLPVDLILSSGFCAFARQAGVIAAVEDFSIPIDRVVGTSSGALAAALYANGMNADQIATELRAKRPIELLKPSIRLHRGAFSLRGLVAHLRTILPKDFKDLEKPLAVGVFETESGLFRLIDDGDLPSAVAASCAIPYVFQAVQAGNPPVYMADGGFKDRLGVSSWAKWSGSTDKNPRKAIINLVGNQSVPSQPLQSELYHEYILSNPSIVEAENTETVAECLVSPSKTRHIVVAPAHTSLFVVRTPRANASLMNLKDFENQRQVAYALAAKGMISKEFKSFMTQN